MSAHVLLAAFVAILLPAPLHGWGDVGHSITGHIAMSYFYGNTAALMASIVPDVAGNISDPSVASWPDTIRCANCSYPYTNPSVLPPPPSLPLALPSPHPFSPPPSLLSLCLRYPSPSGITR